MLLGCGSTKTTYNSDSTTPLNETLQDKNRVGITLLNRIRQVPGITIRSGLPIFNKTNNSLSSEGSSEPLYVLNGYIVGNSFRDVNELVDNVNVKKIEALTGSDAAVYGSRGSNGVLLITTY
jgi:hypothetical protein